MRSFVIALIVAISVFAVCTWIACADDAAPTRADLLKAQIATVQAQSQAARAVTSAGQLQAENGKLWEEKLQAQEAALKSELDSLAKTKEDNPKKQSAQEK